MMHIVKHRKINRYLIVAMTVSIMSVLLAGCSSSKSAAATDYSGSSAQSSDGGGTVAVAGSSTAKALIKEARQWLGTKYAYGGHSRKGTDCSGMVMEVYGKVCDIKLPRSSAEQQRYCKEVKRKDLKAGDLVFFATGKSKSRVSHVGLYIGDGEMIHASASRGVIVSRLDEKYYDRNYHSSGRVLAMKDSEKDKKHKDKESKDEKESGADKKNKSDKKNKQEKKSKPDKTPEVDFRSLDELLDAKIDSIYYSGK